MNLFYLSLLFQQRFLNLIKIFLIIYLYFIIIQFSKLI